MEKVKTCVVCLKEYETSELTDKYDFGEADTEGGGKINTNCCSAKCTITFMKDAMKRDDVTEKNKKEVKLLIKSLEKTAKLEELIADMKAIVEKPNKSIKDNLKIKSLAKKIARMSGTKVSFKK